MLHVVGAMPDFQLVKTAIDKDKGAKKQPFTFYEVTTFY